MPSGISQPPPPSSGAGRDIPPPVRSGGIPSGIDRDRRFQKLSIVGVEYGLHERLRVGEKTLQNTTLNVAVEKDSPVIE